MLNLNPQNLHHAYICEGDKEIIFPHICDFCENDLNLKIKSNPDFYYEEVGKFLISHARRLKEIQFNKTTDSGKKIFIISFDFITREAQNALLKILEEPTEGTHFFFITPSSHIFLDTVLSRMQIISGFKNSNDSAIGKVFLKYSFSEKMKHVTKLIQNIKDEKASKADAINLVRSVIRLRHEEIKKDKDILKIKTLSEMEKIADYLYDNSASVKTLMEYFAIIA